MYRTCQSWVVLWVGLALLCTAIEAQAQPPVQSQAFGNSDTEVETLLVYSATLEVDSTVWAKNFADFDSVMATHPEEVYKSIPGVWVSRGSGQEHLLAIRSPVLNGSGACGAFNILENGIAIRPVGFCNVNNLFETTYEMADSVEVVAGPASARYGGNALHGAINVGLNPTYSAQSQPSIRIHQAIYESSNLGFEAHLDIGSEAAIVQDIGGWRVRASLVDQQSFRDQESNSQAKIHASYSLPVANNERLQFSLSHTSLNQNTAGYARGLDAYLDDALRTGNANEGAYRDAYSTRLYADFLYGPDSRNRLTGYLRVSNMEFQQHWRPTKPVESNAHASWGIRWLTQWHTNWSLQVVAEQGHVTLDQFQAAETRVVFGSEYPQGYQYNYEVDFSDVRVSLAYGIDLIADQLRLDVDLLLQQLTYDYQDLLETPIFESATDKQDFSEDSLRLGLSGQLNDKISWNVNYSQGFRPPQIAELYRLQSGQTVSPQLSSELLEQFEVRFEFALSTSTSLVTSLYTSDKSDSIGLDEDTGQLTNFGRTSHTGLEWQIKSQPSDKLALIYTGSYAEHLYKDRASDNYNNEIDSAPNLIHTLRVDWQVAPERVIWIERYSLSEYYTDASNEHSYDGHVLYTAGLSWQSSGRWRVDVTVKNVADKLVADRADFAFGSERYFPAAPRTVHVGFQWNL